MVYSLVEREEWEGLGLVEGKELLEELLVKGPGRSCRRDLVWLTGRSSWRD